MIDLDIKKIGVWTLVFALVALVLTAGGFFITASMGSITAFMNTQDVNSKNIKRITSSIEGAEQLWNKANDLLNESKLIYQDINQFADVYQIDKDNYREEYRKIQIFLQEHHNKLEALKNSMHEFHRTKHKN